MTCNLVAPDSGASVPTIELLRSWYGNKMDNAHLEPYRGQENAFKPLYSINRMATEFGIVPKKRLRPQPDSGH
ncbi:hypothetical protein [Paenibacillus gorillae]|uniref:hypothetical protein n=1 Tax=Paenibacillus gorillae TaxID=1243662 RepID=UPI0004BB59C4|nr:hypothetical protein [Paenibacillus gorillae]